MFSPNDKQKVNMWAYGCIISLMVEFVHNVYVYWHIILYVLFYCTIASVNCTSIKMEKKASQEEQLYGHSPL